MRKSISFAVVIALAGCPGKAPTNPDDEPDAAVEVDAPAEVALMLTGKVVDYFGNVNVADAALSTSGMAPEGMTTSATDGAYKIDVIVGSKFFVLATKTGYRPTRNMAVTIADMSVAQDLYVLSTQDINNNYPAAAGTAAVAGTAFLAADLRRNNNQPLDGIPLTDIQLLDAANAPVAGVKGPYVFNSSGALDNTLTTTATFQGRSRVAYLDVPPGTYTLVTTYPKNGGGTETINTTVTTTADGATLVLSGGGGAGGGAAITDPSFATHIYPKLQRAALNGLGCANCHTLSGTAAVLKYDEPAATVLANITARTGVVNTAVPADSFLLKRPLYEPTPPQDHPNATFLDTNDADYKLFLLWITNGAKP